MKKHHHQEHNVFLIIMLLSSSYLDGGPRARSIDDGSSWLGSRVILKTVLSKTITDYGGVAENQVDSRQSKASIYEIDEHNIIISLALFTLNTSAIQATFLGPHHHPLKYSFMSKKNQKLATNKPLQEVSAIIYLFVHVTCTV